MNKLIYCLIVIVSSACASSQQPLPNYAKDNLWCWQRVDNQWKIRGAAITCPDNVVYWNSK